MASDLRTRAVLAPTMLAIIGAVYWLDWNTAFGLRQGTLSAGMLGLLGLLGVHEYVALLQGAGFPVSRRLLPSVMSPIQRCGRTGIAGDSPPAASRAAPCSDC